MSTYTLVIEGDCPAIVADMEVYLQTDVARQFSGKVKGVMFDDALLRLEACEDALQAKGE